MAASYKVEFILEDWMREGLKSGEYMIKSGNLLEAQSHQVVKWLDVAHIFPPDEVKGMLGNAMNLAKSAASTTSVNLVVSTINLALGVAIYRKLDSIENQIVRCWDQLQQLSECVNDIHEEQIRGFHLYPILQGFELFARARVSSNREYLLESARIKLADGMTSATYWLQTRSCSKLLKDLNLVENISTALMQAAIAEAQIIRILEKSPIEGGLVFPFKKAREFIIHLEDKLKKKRVPGSRKEIESIENLPNLFKCNKALKIAANESLNLQLALIQGEMNIIEFDPNSNANKAICLVQPRTRLDLWSLAT